MNNNARRSGDITAIEKGLLGAIIVNPGIVDSVKLRREWFTTSEAWSLLDAVDSLAVSGKPSTIPNLVAKLRDMTGGHDFMQRILGWKESATSELHMETQASFLKREYQLREAEKALRSVYQDIKNGEFSAEVAMERLYAAVTEDDDVRHSYTAQEAAKITMKSIVENLQNSDGSGITGITTGNPDLDSITGGLNKGDLVIIAGRPSMGKTSADISLQVAALMSGWKVGFISAEMPIEKVTARMMAAYGKFDLQYTRALPKTEDAAVVFEKLKSANNWYKEQPHFTNDKAAISLAEAARQARQWKRLYGIDCLHVDYTQFLSLDADPRMPKHEKVGTIIKGLKALAKDLQIPVIALSQVSRDVEQRANKRPMMSDLSDSSEIEKTADVVITLYRDEVYDPNTPDKGVIELGIIKQRDGRTGILRAAWLGNCASIGALDDRYGGYNA